MYLSSIKSAILIFDNVGRSILCLLALKNVSLNYKLLFKCKYQVSYNKYNFLFILKFECLVKSYRSHDYQELVIYFMTSCTSWKCLYFYIFIFYEYFNELRYSKKIIIKFSGNTFLIIIVLPIVFALDIWAIKCSITGTMTTNYIKHR